MSTPVPSVLGVASLTNSSATLVGQVVPLSGASAVATFSYWNSTTPQTVLTAVTSVAAGGLPTVVMGNITGLTGGGTYIFKLTFAGQSSSLLSFVAALPTATVTATSAQTANIPHMAFPLSFSSVSGVNVCDQDDDQDVLGCVETVLACTIGQFPEVPSFGIPDLAFSQAPIPASKIAQAVRLWEPRADVQTVTQMINDGTTGTWGIDLTVTPQTS